jgi:hypothetical protein
MTAVAALDASINEFYSEAADRNRNLLGNLTDEQMTLLVALWPTVRRSRIAHKYQVALTACGIDRFDEGRRPFQTLHGLLSLRNALVHFEPEWRDAQKRHRDLEHELKNEFPENALSLKAVGMPWFPGLCLGAGCARWACDTVAAFAADFSSRLGVRDRF